MKEVLIGVRDVAEAEKSGIFGGGGGAGTCIIRAYRIVK